MNKSTNYYLIYNKIRYPKIKASATLFFIPPEKSMHYILPDKKIWLHLQPLSGEKAIMNKRMVR